MKPSLLPLILWAISAAMAAPGSVRAEDGETTDRSDFETGTEGWMSAWENPSIESVTTSVDEAVTGESSLCIVLNNTTDEPQLCNVELKDPPDLQPGDVVQLSYWLPGDPGVSVVAPYVTMDGDVMKNQWEENPRRESWTPIAFELPGDAARVKSVGVQFLIAPGFSGSVLIDSVRW